MATKKRLFLWGRAFRRVSQLSALFAQHCARCAYEGEHGGSHDGHIACLRCSQTIVPAYAEGSPVIPAGYAVAVAGAYVAATPMAAGVVVVAGVIVPVGTAAVCGLDVGMFLFVRTCHLCRIPRINIAITVFVAGSYSSRKGFAFVAPFSRAFECCRCNAVIIAPCPNGSAPSMSARCLYRGYSFTSAMLAL